MKSWKQRIEAAEKRGKFTLNDKVDVSSWTSCAIGERRGGKVFNDHEELIISDKEDDLGMAFFEEVQGGEISEAKRIYEEIQKL